jgi:hypothetical protein
MRFCLPGSAAVPLAQELADIRCEPVASVDSHKSGNAMLLALVRQQGMMFVRPSRVSGKVSSLSRQTMHFGLVAAGSLNPQKARMMLARRNDTSIVTEYSIPTVAKRNACLPPVRGNDACF